MAFADHGPEGTGEALVVQSTPRERRLEHRRRSHHRHQASSGAAPRAESAGPAGKAFLIRADGGRRGPKEFTAWLDRAHRVSYSGRVHPPAATPQPSTSRSLSGSVSPGPQRRWPGAGGQRIWPSFTGLLNLVGWPAGMRVIVHRERPHPGAQLRFDDVDGYRFTALRHQHHPGTLQDLELGIVAAPAARTGSGSRKTPAWPTSRCTGSTQNRIWCQIVTLASELQAWSADAGPGRP